MPLQTRLTQQKLPIAKMIIALLSLLSALTAPSEAQTFTPVHGCEGFTETTPVTNFTLFHRATNDSTPAYVKWLAPVVGVSCSASESSSTAIGTPNTTTTVPCTAPASDETKARFLLSADESSGDLSNATLYFVRYAQCAASIYAFYYKANFPLSCAMDTRGETCVAQGNATARVIRELWLPPMGPPPPPPRGM
jgi:hypothetical protein